MFRITFASYTTTIESNHYQIESVSRIREQTHARSIQQKRNPQFIINKRDAMKQRKTSNEGVKKKERSMKCIWYRIAVAERQMHTNENC